ncbi:hypothetical protein ACHAQA_008670 [Verticillium albo-atrum]
MGGPSPAPSFSAGPSPGVSVPVHPLDRPDMAALTPAHAMHTVPPANMDQLRLLQHYLSGAIPVLAQMPSGMHLAEEALEQPYLMNELLAFSARHLASLHPQMAPRYVFLAREYQAHALSIFNSTQLETAPDKCLQMLIFSWMVGMNLLGDVDCVEDDADVLDDFLRYIDLYRGVRVVASGAWATLRTSDHAPVFRAGESLADKLSEGTQTESLQTLIRDSLGMDDEQKQGSQEALARIQATYDANGGATPKEDSLAEPEGLPPTSSVFELMHDTIGMALAWPQMVTPAFVTSLQAKRPEALLVLAHFAVVMHWCRHHWIVGSVGSRLLRSIVMALGPGWERWLQVPQAMVEGDRGAATPCSTANGPST